MAAFPPTGMKGISKKEWIHSTLTTPHSSNNRDHVPYYHPVLLDSIGQPIRNSQPRTYPVRVVPLQGLPGGKEDIRVDSLGLSGLGEEELGVDIESGQRIRK